MQHFVFLVFFARDFRPQVLAEFAKQQISWHREAVWEPLGSGLVVSFVVFWLNLPTSRGTTKWRGCLWSGTRLVPLISDPPWKNILLRQNHSSFSEDRISVGWRSDNIPCLTIDTIFYWPTLQHRLRFHDPGNQYYPIIVDKLSPSVATLMEKYSLVFSLKACYSITKISCNGLKYLTV